MSQYRRWMLQSLPPYVPGEQLGGSIIKLNTNESPYPPSPKAIAAIAAAAPRLMRYPPPDADDARRALARRLGVGERNVFVANGSDETLRLCFQAYVDPGDAVAWSTPTYTLYDILANFAGARVLDVPRREDFSVDIEALGRARARMVILASPNSPTGTVTSLREIERLASLARLVVVDEAYADFAGVTAADLVKQYENLIVARTLSKSYSLAGLRVGFAVACEELIEDFTLLKDSYNVGVCANAGAAAAIEDEEYAADLRRRIVATRERMTKRLCELGWKVHPSGANFVFAVPPGSDGRAWYERFRDRGIIVRWFGSDPRTSSGVRITVGTDEEIDRMLEVAAAHG